MTDIEVMERLVYDKAQLQGLMKLEMAEEALASLGCCGGDTSSVLSGLAEQLEGLTLLEGPGLGPGPSFFQWYDGRRLLNRRNV